MRPQTALKKLSSLLKKSSFTSSQASSFGITSATLCYYVKTGVLESVARGVYRKAGASILTDFRWEDLILEIQKVKGGVTCLVSALAFYGLTEEIPKQHWIAIPNSTRHRSKTAKIVRMRNTNLGKTMIRLENQKIPIFDRERTIIDSFRYLGKETAIKALKNAAKAKEKIDWQKLRRYAKALRTNIDPYILSVTT